MHEELQKEVDANYEAFRRMLPNLLPRHAKRWALMRYGECIDLYDTLRDAHLAGNRLYEDGIFSTQEVTTSIADQGWYSHAGR